MDRIDDLKTGTKGLRNRLELVFRFINTFSIQGATRMGNTWILPSAGRGRRGGASASITVAKITGSARVSGSPQPWQWTYSWAEAEQTAAGYAGWGLKSGGVTGTNTLRNLTEIMNDDAGLMGNGVDTANLLGTFEIKPIPTGNYVRIWAGNQAGEYWCEYQNAVDGSC